MWMYLLFYPQWSYYHLFSPLLSALTRHQFFSFQLTILFECALFWIIFLVAVFDLAHGFLISTVLITPVFVFLLMLWKIHVIFLVSWRLFLYLLMSFFACHDTLFWLCFLFGPTVLLVLFLFYGFSLPLIHLRWFFVDFYASFLLVNQFNPLAHCLFWLFVLDYAFRTAYCLELTFWTTSAYTALFFCIILTWVLFVNISQCLFITNGEMVQRQNWEINSEIKSGKNKSESFILTSVLSTNYSQNAKDKGLSHQVCQKEE